jgi:NADP-dependent 3-hydroxy acid dehydrogenase YdfG
MPMTQSETAVVNRAAGGIGKARARGFVESGFRVILAEADAAGLRALKMICGQSPRARRAQLAQVTSADAACTRIFVRAPT